MPIIFRVSRQRVPTPNSSAGERFDLLDAADILGGVGQIRRDGEHRLDRRRDPFGHRELGHDRSPWMSHNMF